jgi:hypothetical protein
MLLKPDARFDPETERLVRADILRDLPDPKADWGAPNGHLWIKRLLFCAGVIAVASWVARMGPHGFLKPFSTGQLPEKD